MKTDWRLTDGMRRRRMLPGIATPALYFFSQISSPKTRISPGPSACESADARPRPALAVLSIQKLAIEDQARLARSAASRGEAREELADWPASTREPPTDRSAASSLDHVLPSCLHEWPLPEPRGWVRRVNRPQTEADLKAIRQCVQHRPPARPSQSRARTANRLALEWTLHPRGRPRRSHAPPGQTGA